MPGRSSGLFARAVTLTDLLHRLVEPFPLEASATLTEQLFARLPKRLFRPIATKRNEAIERLLPHTVVCLQQRPLQRRHGRMVTVLPQTVKEGGTTVGVRLSLVRCDDQGERLKHPRQRALRVLRLRPVKLADQLGDLLSCCHPGSAG